MSATLQAEASVESDKKSLSELEEELMELETKYLRSYRWIHKKTRSLYTVVELGFLEKDMSVQVLYRPHEENRYVTFIRPLEEFLEKFEGDDSFGEDEYCGI